MMDKPMRVLCQVSVNVDGVFRMASFELNSKPYATEHPLSLWIEIQDDIGAWIKKEFDDVCG